MATTTLSRRSEGRLQGQGACLLWTPQYLQKGGRIDRAQALPGFILSMKPMINGQLEEIHPPGKTPAFTGTLAMTKWTAPDFAQGELIH